MPIMLELKKENVNTLDSCNDETILDYILYNLEKPISKESIDMIIEYFKEKNDIYQIVLDRIMTSTCQENKENFILASIRKEVSFPIENILKCFYEKPDESKYPQEKPKVVLSKLPGILLSQENLKPEIKELIEENAEIFFLVESSQKMKVMDYLYNNLPERIINKYESLRRLYHAYILIDDRITKLINANEEAFLIELLEDKKIRYVTSGTTTSVFKVGNKALKFSNHKYEPNSEQELFLIAPTQTRIVYDKNGNPQLFIEIQDYLENSFNNQSITVKDINNFLIELDKQGFYTTDPNCLERLPDNFGFLRDYHDANLAGFNDFNELPEWFKERPIVLYDIDLVYKKEKKNTDN